MVRFLVILILCAAILLPGCTVTETTQQRHRRLAQVTDINSRMMVDDWDYVWLYDHSSTLSEWHTQIGK